jgi:hypothetical protein
MAECICDALRACEDRVKAGSMSNLAKAAKTFQKLQMETNNAYSLLLKEVCKANENGITHTNISRESGLSRMTIRKHCRILHE